MHELFPEPYKQYNMLHYFNKSLLVYNVILRLIYNVISVVGRAGGNCRSIVNRIVGYFVRAGARALIGGGGGGGVYSSVGQNTNI